MKCKTFIQAFGRKLESLCLSSASAARSLPLTCTNISDAKKKGLSFISNRQQRKEGMFCASELAGIEPTPARSIRAVYARLNLSGCLSYSDAISVIQENHRYISHINLGYATLVMPLSILVYATLQFGICHLPFWSMPLTILVYATFHFGLCYFPFVYMPLSILGYATFHPGICYFPFWDMPLSILVYATFHFGICRSYVYHM